ncbi:MAG TPA: SGNH/GDSL hydrolase family protein [Polyangiaceae bacterium]|nr:SGNH/GDSL hydrolase family protein [Polyangiaceae bacterium]
MVRKLSALVLLTSALSACGSDAGNNTSAGPLNVGGAFTGGVPGAGGTAPVATGTAGTVASPGSGGAVSMTGSGGVPVSSGTGGSGISAAGGATMTGAGGTTSPASGGATESTGGAGVGGTSGASAGGAAGSAGMGGGGGTGGMAAEKPACLKNSSEVVFLGDSYVNYDVAHPALQLLVAQDAVKDGALMSGQAYRSYAVAGATMAAASLNMIPPQWPQAKAASADITTVIMDGGGNDVLINNPQCKAAGSENDATCKMVVANTVMAVGNLIDDFQKTGVGDLIYFFYPHAPVGGADISDYALGILQNSAKVLSTPTFRMYVVDLVPLFDNHPEYYYIDGIHANATGEQVIADAIYQVMKDHCIAQPASKGCCMP